MLSGRGRCDGPITCTEKTYGCLTLVSVVCCQVEVCALGSSMYRVVVWVSVCFECCVLSGRGLCEGLILFTGESYGCLSFVSVCCQVEFCATG